MPAISVIIPVYNVEPYLRECLDSVVNQTFRDLEIICVNDGSTDGSPAILEEYAAKDNRIQIVTKENGGLNTARNAGLARVTGEYFAILDSDDWLDVTAYEKAYARAKESGADMTQFFFTLVDFPNGKELIILNTSCEIDDQAEKIQCVMNNWSVCWCYLWKTEFVKKNKLQFHNDLKSNDEITFTYKAALLANKISVIPERLHYYRFRASSLTGNKKEPTLLQRPWAFTLLFQDIKNCKISEISRLRLYQIKWGSLHDTFYNVIDKSFRSKMGHNIKQYVTSDERNFMIANEKSFDTAIFNFFVIYSGSTFFRWKYNIRKVKSNTFDWVAKKLIPYSPWLQRTLEIVDIQHKQIQELQDQLKK